MTDTQPIPYEHLNDEITPPAYNIQHPVLWQRFLCRQPWSTTEEREKTRSDVEAAYPETKDRARVAMGCLRDLT